MLLRGNELPSGFISPLKCEIHFDHQTYLAGLQGAGIIQLGHRTEMIHNLHHPDKYPT